MDPYREMYVHLFHKMTDIIEEMKAVQRETEELFLAAGEDEDTVELKKSP